MTSQDAGIIAGIIALPVSIFGSYLALRTTRVAESTLRQTVRVNDLDALRTEVQFIEAAYDQRIQTLEHQRDLCLAELKIVESRLDALNPQSLAPREQRPSQAAPEG